MALIPADLQCLQTASVAPSAVSPDEPIPNVPGYFPGAPVTYQRTKGDLDLVSMALVSEWFQKDTWDRIVLGTSRDLLAYIEPCDRIQRTDEQDDKTLRYEFVVHR